MLVLGQTGRCFPKLRQGSQTSESPPVTPEVFTSVSKLLTSQHCAGDEEEQEEEQEVKSQVKDEPAVGYSVEVL